MSMTEADFTQKIREAFDAADTNKNGALEMSEARVLAQNMAENRGNTFDEEKFAARFASTDKNADGKITWEEFSSSAIAAAKKNGIVE